MDEDGTTSCLPAVSEARCVHGRVPIASCRACVMACPTGAWDLTDDALFIDAAQCDGCGLCVAACPEQALTLPSMQLVVQAGKRDVMVGCDRIADRTGMLAVPCVHAIGLAQLIQLYRTGMRALQLCTPPCGQCSRYRDDYARRAVEQFNRVVESRAGERIVLRRLDPDLARERCCALSQDGNVQHARRQFLARWFRNLDRTAVGDTCDSIGKDWPSADLPPPEPGKAAAFFAPRIDLARCVGCDACVRMCPHGVITVTESPPAYVFDVDACSGCGLCVDVCGYDAIELAECGLITQWAVQMDSGRCRACGTHYHRPAVQREPTGLCHVCSRVDHRRQLFQVL